MLNFQFDSSSTSSSAPPEPPLRPVPFETVELLRQLLEVQREQLNHLRAAAAAHDMGARWRAFLERWQGEFPDLSDTCRKALPVLEQCYGKLLAELTEQLSGGGDALDNDFALQEFLDRYGMRLGQLGTMINLVAPLAEAAERRD
jgi:hypothetical protein